jgi:selenocysteine-specific elongation factor
VVPAAGDRFVLRQVAPPDTIGGGVILDPAPRKHGAGPDHVERLRLLEHGDALERLEAQLAGSPSGLSEGDADRVLLERMCTAGRARRVGKRRRSYFAPAQLERARSRLLGVLDKADSRRPVSRGALADAAGLSDLAAASVLEELVAADEVRVRGPGFVPARRVSGDDPRVESLLDALLADGLEPRGVDALAATVGMTGDEARGLLEELALEGRVAAVKPGIYYHPDGLAEARRRVVSLCRRDGSVTIARLRDELRTSRKYTQALLEYLDAQRVTRRDGDAHVLRRGADEKGA